HAGCVIGRTTPFVAGRSRTKEGRLHVEVRSARHLGASRALDRHRGGGGRVPRVPAVAPLRLARGARVLRGEPRRDREGLRAWQPSAHLSRAGAAGGSAAGAPGEEVLPPEHVLLHRDPWLAALAAVPRRAVLPGGAGRGPGTAADQPARHLA